jgi:hypothetical protein
MAYALGGSIRQDQHGVLRRDALAQGEITGDNSLTSAIGLWLQAHSTGLRPKIRRLYLTLNNSISDSLSCIDKLKQLWHLRLARIGLRT